VSRRGRADAPRIVIGTNPIVPAISSHAELVAMVGHGSSLASPPDPPLDPEPVDDEPEEEHLPEAVTLYADLEAIADRRLALLAKRAAARARGMGRDDLVPALELLAKVAAGE
jgi:hypothetical protein